MSDEELLGDTGIRWSSESIRKAEDLVLLGRVHRDADAPEVFFVEGSQIYRVQTDGEEYITCTCPNGMRKGRPHCYHTAAVLIMIRDEQESERPGQGPPGYGPYDEDPAAPIKEES